MQTSRRTFLTGLISTGVLPAPVWADAGDPAYLAAARATDGSYSLAGLTGAGKVRFTIPLPARGHAATAHPLRPEAIAFARRPGTFAMVIDCIHGRILATLNAPEGRHFYGHGAFSRDGTLLFTPENDYDNGRGVIGVWDRDAAWLRVGEFSSGGIGPHEMLRLPGKDVFVVANGGIETHPDTGRAKLNIPEMRPNLTYVTSTGQALDQVAPPDHMNSLRHLAVTEDGLVGCALQWQGDRSEAPALLALHHRGEALKLVQAPDGPHPQLNGYAGSISFTGQGEHVAITSPRGGVVQIFTRDGQFVKQHAMDDVCGVAPGQADSFLATAGTGRIAVVDASGIEILNQESWQWDNHLVKVG